MPVSFPATYSANRWGWRIGNRDAQANKVLQGDFSGHAIEAFFSLAVSGGLQSLICWAVMGRHRLSSCRTVLSVDFQVTILKVLVSYPDGFASLDNLKRDVAILATCGKDWSERTERLAAQLPNLAIFSQGLVERLEGGWRITQQGRDALAFMEAPSTRA